MTGTNHFLAGAAIGLTVGNPVVAVPVAFASHFVLDALPHFGVEYDEKLKRRPKIFHYIVTIDAAIGATFLALALLLAYTQSLWLVPVCMIAALSPDFIWIYRYTIRERFGTLPPLPKGPLTRFHSNIQRYERLWGIAVEVLFLVAMCAIIWRLN